MLTAMLASRGYIYHMVWEYQNDHGAMFLSTAAVLVEKDTLIVTS